MSVFRGFWHGRRLASNVTCAAMLACLALVAFHPAAFRSLPRPAAAAGSTLQAAGGKAITRMLIPIPACTSYRGVVTSIAPAAGLAVKATIANHGQHTVTVFRGGLGAWSICVLGEGGRPLAAAYRVYNPVPARSPCRLLPGVSRSTTLGLSRYPEVRGAGTFYIYAMRALVAKGLASGWMTTPVLRLTLRNGLPPLWKIVPKVPTPRKKIASRPSRGVAPPPPKITIPTTGPIATLARIAAAVRARDLATVQRLCFQGHHASEPFYVAFAQRAIAAGDCTEAVEKRFRVNPWPHLVPSPEVFSHILRRLDTQSLEVNGTKASVGVLWFHNGSYVLLPSFAYHFRKIKGRWLLDSWATQESAPHATARSYRLNVENSLRECQMFRALARAVSAGKFSSLHAFRAAARRGMAKVGRWFMEQSGPVNPRVSAPRRAQEAALPRAYYGVRIAISPSHKRAAVVTAAITNGGMRPVTLLSGGPFGWRLVASDAQGVGLAITQAQQKRWQARSAGRRIKLPPGRSISRTFNVRRYCVLPRRGTFYIYVSRFVTVNGASCPVTSPILRLTINPGAVPLWKVVPAVPQPKPRPVAH